MHLAHRVLLLTLALTGCHAARIEPFGEAKLNALCVDVKRCDARGDKVVNLLKQSPTTRLYLSADKGPEQLLGKVAPGRKADSVMKTCGAEVAANDWLIAPDAVRELKLGSEGKRTLRARLQAYLAARVATLEIAEGQSAEESIRNVADEVVLDRVSWVSQTYWLTDGAFERRVAQCGEEDRDNIIYSMTVIAPSASFQADLTGKLLTALDKKLTSATPSDASVPAIPAIPASPDAALEAPGEGDAGVPQTTAERHETIARDVVRALARDTRVVAALGFDDP